MRWFSLLWCFVSVLSFGQPAFINWSEDNRDHTSLVSLMPVNGMDFYAFRRNYSGLITTPRVVSYKQGLEETRMRIEEQVTQNAATLEDVIYFGGKLVVFLSDLQDGYNNLYMVTYDQDMQPTGEESLLASYPVAGIFRKKGNFYVVVSDNGKFFSVEYSIPAKRDEYEYFGYRVVNDQFQIVQQGERELPYRSRLMSIDTRYLSENGEYFIGLSIFTSSDFGIWRDYSSLEKTVVMHVDTSGLKPFVLQLDNRKVYDFELTVLDSNLFVTGTYGQPFSAGAKGFFFQKINIESAKIERESLQEFPPDVLEQEQVRNRFNERMRGDFSFQSRLNDELMNYAFRGIHPQQDGSVVVVAEQFYIYQTSSSDGRGLTQTVNHYYYNDLLIYKIDSIGAIAWLKRVPKTQHSVNDYGYYSSMVSVDVNGSIHCFFNDHSLNYDESGVYDQNFREVSFPMRPRNYVLAEVILDPQTGDMLRSIKGRHEETNGFVVLKLSAWHKSKRQLLFYANGARERFGLLQF